MNNLRLLGILLIMLGFLLLGQRYILQSNNEEVQGSKDSIPTSTNTPAPTKTPTATPANDASNPTLSPTPTNIPATSTPEPTPTPSNPQVNQSVNISDFKYPNSTIISQSGSNLNLESTNNPNSITNWYRDKIKSLDMSVTTFVQTTTNGNVLNKLAGADGKKKVEIEITKDNNSQTVKINVSLIS